VSITNASSASFQIIMAVYLSVANKDEVHVSNIKKLIHHLAENTLRVYYKHQQCKFSDYHGGVFKSGYKNEVHVSNIKKKLIRHLT
jgi:isochorismate hydrolase